jgi:phosphopantothenoylcysteine synthetase/decarboxylase
MKIYSYRTYDQLKEKMEMLVKTEKPDVIIHSAAVSDYKPEGLYYRDEQKEMIKIDTSGKASSDYKDLWLHLIQTEKIVDLIRPNWGFAGMLIKFKLQAKMTEEELANVATRSMHHSEADFIVANCLEWFGVRALIVDARDDSVQKVSRRKLAQELERRIR